MTQQIDLIEGAIDRCRYAFTETEDVVHKYDTSFPIAVFGTLRKIPRPMGNTQRMYEAHEPASVRKGFIEHCTFVGIKTEFKQGGSGAVEVFFHEPEQFSEVIPSIDRLEGFSPGSGRRYGYGYHRTLLRARLLPDDHSNTLFDRGINWDDRDLGIGQSEWKEFPWVPVWMYSNRRTNESLSDIKDGPLIWEG